MTAIAGADAAGAGPRRTCIGCRTVASPVDLIRLVVVDGQVRVDEGRVLAGRGAWLHLSTQCLDLADRRRAWGRALRARDPLDVSGVQEWVRARV